MVIGFGPSGGRERQHPVIARFGVRRWPEDDCLHEIVGYVLPLGVSVDVIVSRRARIVRVDIGLGHITSCCSDHKNWEHDFMHRQLDRLRIREDISRYSERGERQEPPIIEVFRSWLARINYRKSSSSSRLL